MCICCGNPACHDTGGLVGQEKYHLKQWLLDFFCIVTKLLPSLLSRDSISSIGLNLCRDQAHSEFCSLQQSMHVRDQTVRQYKHRSFIKENRVLLTPNNTNSIKTLVTGTIKEVKKLTKLYITKQDIN